MADVICFDKFELDTDTFELKSSGKPVPVEPLVFELLVVLARQPKKVVSRDALIESVWDGRFVSESTVSTAIKSARKALGDTGNAQNFIRTIRGRGFQFVGEVIQTDETAIRTEIQMQPALYVRRVHSDNATQPLAEFLDARVRAVLGRIPLLRIGAGFRDANEIDDPKLLHARLGMTHVLEVHLSGATNAINVDITLIDTRSGFQIWGQPFSATTSQHVQDDVLHAIVSRAEPEIIRAMITELSGTGKTVEPKALIIQAMGLLSLNGWNRVTFGQASDLLERSIQIDPDIPLSHAFLALIRALGHRVGILRDDPGIIEKAVEAADNALELESRDSMILGLVGCALADVGKLDRAMPILKKAIDTNPANGHAKTAMGAALIMQGEYDSAVTWLRDGIKISPADSRLAIWEAVLATAELARGNDEKALDAAESACSQDDRNYIPRLALAAVHVNRGNQTEMKLAVTEVLRTNPKIRKNEVVFLVGTKLGAPIWAEVGHQRDRQRKEAAIPDVPTS